ncbi:AbrB/MazE/SpoVT family DNA-binding domain-containing protein [Candidatus Uhrbacteria bacterium]|nr:AbrB/MazE/SpoVT family DNA-binding domain-containing protein [Candidatus Uhrbacteria bacterium]
MKEKNHFVSITRQGQLTVPKTILREFGITKAVKAVVRKRGDVIVVSPKADFWSLQGALKTRVRLTDAQLKKVRASFAKQWPRYAKKRS